MPAQSTSVEMARELIESADPARLVELLEEGHSIYDQQTTQDVSEIRVRILLALARRPLPDAALRAVLEELENGHDPHLVAAAAIALRAHPQPSGAFDSYVQRAQENMRALDDLISFETLAPDPKIHACTTPLRELERTAEWLRDKGVTAECCPVPPILNFFKRTSSIDNLLLEDQNGVSGTYRKLFTGHPSVVAFFYTRCDNPLKCSLTVWKLARLQRALEARGVGTAIHTAAITYDSEFDTPERLRRFALNRDFRLNENHSMYRVQGGIDPLRAHFRLGVNFFEGLVNRHRIELFVLDREGNVAASYQRLQWEEQEVCNKAVALLTNENSGHCR
jgi:cytochrome oxidase Cu insertion factor (SCO1/SenC/PrrC family)